MCIHDEHHHLGAASGEAGHAGEDLQGRVAPPCGQDDGDLVGRVEQDPRLIQDRRRRDAAGRPEFGEPREDLDPAPGLCFDGPAVGGHELYRETRLHGCEREGCRDRTGEVENRLLDPVSLERPIR